MSPEESVECVSTKLHEKENGAIATLASVTLLVCFCEANMLHAFGPSAVVANIFVALAQADVTW